MHAKMAARVTTLTAVISVCVLMAGLGMTAVRILMTVPVLPATKGPPVMTGWRRLSVNVLLGAQDCSVSWMMPASATHARRAPTVTPTLLVGSTYAPALWDTSGLLVIKMLMSAHWVPTLVSMQGSV